MMSSLHAPVDLSVVVPCFNEEHSLKELLRRVVAACDATNLPSYEIILVDDGSTDDTWKLIKQAATQAGSNVVGVTLSRNHGHQLALSAGLATSRGDKVFVIDADLQDPPELLSPMLDKIEQGADVVYGVRQARAGETRFKKVTASLFYRILDRLTDIAIPLDTGDFRLMRREVVDVLNRMPESHRFIRGMVSWIGFRQEPVFYERGERFAGDTKYPIGRMLKLAFDAITGFSVKPLAIASYCGGTLGLAGLLTMTYVLWSWFNGNTIQGWTSLISIVLIMGSLQLVFLGVIGEYLGRLYIESKRRPMFIIKDITRTENSGE